ncbi:MAG TPA: hypothetical protein VIF57_29985 [Polyangia bacterium]|jgi:hypothetical protein
MRPLEDEERALLELVRDADDPSDEDRARVRAALAQRLGAVAGLGTAAGAGVAASVGSSAKAAVAAAGTGGGLGAGATSGVAAGGTLAVKLIGVAVVAASAMGGGAAAVHHARHTPVALIAPSHPATHRHQPRVARDEGSAPPLPLAQGGLEGRGEGSDPPLPLAQGGLEGRGEGQPLSGAVRPGDAPHLAPAAPASPGGRGNDRDADRALEPPTTAPARAPRSVARRAAPAAAPASALNLPTLADEARLVHEGVAALRTGEPGRALTLFDAHAALYPRGALAEERAAERVFALVDLGRAAEARAAAAEFLRAHPASPLAARVRARLHALDAAR